MWQPLCAHYYKIGSRLNYAIENCCWCCHQLLECHFEWRRRSSCCSSAPLWMDVYTFIGCAPRENFELFCRFLFLSFLPVLMVVVSVRLLLEFFPSFSLGEKSHFHRFCGWCILRALIKSQCSVCPLLPVRRHYSPLLSS